MPEQALVNHVDSDVKYIGILGLVDKSIGPENLSSTREAHNALKALFKNLSAGSTSIPGDQLGVDISDVVPYSKELVRSEEQGQGKIVLHYPSASWGTEYFENALRLANNYEVRFNQSGKYPDFIVLALPEESEYQWWVTTHSLGFVLGPNSRKFIREVPLGAHGFHELAHHGMARDYPRAYFSIIDRHPLINELMAMNYEWVWHKSTPRRVLREPYHVRDEMPCAPCLASHRQIPPFYAGTSFNRMGLPRMEAGSLTSYNPGLNFKPAPFDALDRPTYMGDTYASRFLLPPFIATLLKGFYRTKYNPFEEDWSQDQFQRYILGLPSDGDVEWQIRQMIEYADTYPQRLEAQLSQGIDPKQIKAVPLFFNGLFAKTLLELKKYSIPDQASFLRQTEQYFDRINLTGILNDVWTRIGRKWATSFVSNREVVIDNYGYTTSEMYSVRQC